MKIVRYGSEKYRIKKQERYKRLHLIKKFRCKECGCVFYADASKDEWILWSVNYIRKRSSELRAKCPYCEKIVRRKITGIIKAYLDRVLTPQFKRSFDTIMENKK